MYKDKKKEKDLDTQKFIPFKIFMSIPDQIELTLSL